MAPRVTNLSCRLAANADSPFQQAQSREYFPVLCEVLVKTLFDPSVRRALTTRLQALQPDSPRRWGRMSPHQAICHVSDAFRVALGERTAAAQARPSGAAMRLIALYLPVHGPRDVPTMPEVAQGVGGTPPVDFESDRLALFALMDRFCARQHEPSWPRHPMFGRMRAKDWGRWGYLHLDHHLRQFGV